jgi:F-type H+-transporting ATPase subunit a
MDMTHISPDQVIYTHIGPFAISATLVYTWLIILLLVTLSIMITRRLSSGPKMSRGQNVMEILVGGLLSQIRDVSGEDPEPYLGFVGTLFVFIVISNVLAVVPGFTPPTASLSTTAALAICVFVAVPFYGISSQGFGSYMKLYIKPSVFMLPFNIMGELSRTLALAVRLFGNMMSATKIVMILLAVAPLFFPVVMNALGLLTGIIQAYIFAILAMVYIASASQARKKTEEKGK